MLNSPKYRAGGRNASSLAEKARCPMARQEMPRTGAVEPALTQFQLLIFGQPRHTGRNTVIPLKVQGSLMGTGEGEKTCGG